jgi:acetyltransferase-like isoleucine patch superfamily enzyme
MNIHPTAEVSSAARIGEGTRIWHHAQIREDAELGSECIVGKNVYIDRGVKIGNRVKIQSNALLYHGLTIEDGVFIGPGATTTNDVLPRAITPDGLLKTDSDWDVGPVVIRYGASIGAGAIILPHVTIGRFALVAAGALVTRSVPDHTIVVGAPARPTGFACQCGRRMDDRGDAWYCAPCDWWYEPALRRLHVIANDR